MNDKTFAALAAPFPADKIHWRVGATTGDKKKGIALAYLDARDVMERLDEVIGPQNWQCEYPFAGCCRIGINVTYEAPLAVLADGNSESVVMVNKGWVWKSNGAGQSDIEGEKGQFSDAFKRAAVLWGIGRYLYDLPNTWVELEAKGRTHVIKTPPKLPAWALPSNGAGGAPEQASRPESPVPLTKDEEDIRYLQDLVNQDNGNYERVYAEMKGKGVSVTEAIAAYEKKLGVK